MPLTLFVIVAAVILYLYLKRAGVAIVSSGAARPAVTISKGVGDLLRWAQGAGLRAVENQTGEYILVPQPGFKLDIPGLASDARKQGFNATAAGSQLYVSLPYTGAQ